MIKSIVTGGGHEQDKVHGARLAHLMSGVDYVLQYDVSDLVDAAREAYPDAFIGVRNK
ncbi:hypothetical protein [Sinorhizobium medicae]|uniref:hypothetical protein n=1 Tax=Sinorhizobium medicae TaxID=110321 RepID=UPI0003FEC06A|nr:hypothetical protein [Sinorhizobium medicae]MDX0451590.1 hypothetical protein [Sinorhizobium medicae]MDX0537680.1 hypothetical protein [Sinorhizobium medicae]MDX1047764.1 hypothetical protein [Sinorhizobium medicae]MDX1060295.1 hypothetical protein [Sinorhizobium medicae]MDX1134481.1 hypothetical protein [Sinorhizobium medicae]